MPPIDWLQDPIESRTWRYHLHTLQYLDVLFDAYERDGERAALQTASALACDWVRQNRPHEPGISEFAWYDMAVGLRSSRLAYLLRAGLAEGLVDESDAELLLTSVLEHAEYLLADENYKAGHNHGLFQDEGLLQLAHLLPTLPAAEGWRQVGARRAEATLRETICWEEGVHLEHSPGYQLTVIALLQRFIEECELHDPAFYALLDRMKEVAGWLVLPNGRTPPIGDTDYHIAPASTREAARHAVGARTFFKSGYAVVRTPDACLIVTSGYHGRGHKQADELSFLLYEQGRIVIGEAGRYGYYESDPGREFARSSSAHNTVEVDNKPFAFRRQAPYGSGILASGAGLGWYAIEAENRLLAAQQAEHQRLLIYRPGSAVVVLDRVQASAQRRYRRLIHLGEGISTDCRHRRVLLSADGFSGAVEDFTPARVKVRSVRGQTEPCLQGWTFPRDRDWRPVECIELDCRARGAVLVTAITLGADAVGVDEVRWEGASRRAQIQVGAEAFDLNWTRSGRVLEVSRG